MKATWTKVVGVMITVLVAGSVPAQDRAGEAQSPSASDTSGAERGARARRKPTKVIEMDVLEVIGKVQKPRVYYVIGRGELKYHGLPLERDLLKEVEKAVDGPPF